jgi:peptide chain release factor 1
MDGSLRSKLERITRRFEEVGHALCLPEVAADKKRMLELAREHAELRPLAEGYARYRAIDESLAEAEELLEDPDLRELAQSDIETLRAEQDELETVLQGLLVPKDPNDSRNVILEIRAGTGGEEAALFAADLWRMYARYAERQGWTMKAMNVSEAGAGGVREVIALIKGRDVYAKLKFERGVHRVQRVPSTESQGRIHTSTATVAIMPEAEEIDVAIQEGDLRIDVMRSSGSGGQHVNTTDSAVRITHIPSGIAVHCQQEKSQIKNRQIAMQLLRARLLAREVERYEMERAAQRKEQVGSGERSEKVRTYNFPQDRITDHRVNITRHNLPGFLDGELDDIVLALRAHDEAKRLADARAG